MTVLVLSLVLALAGCTGLVLAGRGKWQGWAVGLGVQPVWAVFALVTRGYGLLLTCLMFGTVYARNLAKWRRDRVRTPELVDPIGWDSARSRMHDVELQVNGRLLHFSTCWCRTPDYGDEQQRQAWVAGYEWALLHPDDEGVIADQRRLIRGASV